MRVPPAALVVLMLVGLGVALAAQLHRAQRANYKETITLFSADLPAGAKLAAEAISIREVEPGVVPRSNIPVDAVNGLVGRRLLKAVTAGEPLSWDDLDPQQPLGPVPKRGRAISIDVDAHRAVDGRIEAGDHVDLLATLTDPRTGERVTRTLSQNLIVLGATHRKPPEPDSVTLLVLEGEAEALLLAEDLGHLALSLRNPADPQTQELEGRASIKTVLTGERFQPSRCGHTIQVIRASPEPRLKTASSANKIAGEQSGTP